ncbi:MULTISPECIES: peptidylprolyl isomerase [unclassified Parabacteroides]|uniref:peptidylprolyl isomerase n=1 Tax=unclassified Parabacteroides TaxID=2649774 RepID=UPI00247461AC|nr:MULTISPECIES: peptidylprolyl isomerase [unclassified Parabacteroides]
MRKILIISFVLVSFMGSAQIPDDSVIMTVAGKQVPLSEFEFIAKKNNEVDFTSEKSLKEYIELFKNFKLKVADAESEQLDQTSAFKQELEDYTSQLKMSYLYDKQAEEDAARVIYDRAKNYLEISQILFPVQGQHLAKDTVAVYEQAMEAYNRIKKGEDFDKVGTEMYSAYRHHLSHHAHGHDHGHAHAHDNDDCVPVAYEYIPCFLPFQKAKIFEEKAYTMKVGEVSLPIRSSDGFHLIYLKSKKEFPGLIRVANIRIGFEKDSVTRTKEEALKIAEEVYQKAISGEDFGKLVEEYTSDENAGDGALPPIRPGELIKEIEDIAFSLQNPGDISKPFLTEYGYHILRLIERVPKPTFESEKEDLIASMKRDEHNFDLFKGFDERLKKEYNCTFYPEAYAELEKLAGEHFPSSNEFFDKAVDMKKTLVVINGIDFPQSELAYYMNRYPYSTKTYACDFMQEIYDLFVRDIVTGLERENMDVRHPEIPYLMQEYKDGMLLFEISNQKVWSQPLEQQEAIEKKWIAELNKKYPVKINQKVLKKMIIKK